jgi:predicted amidohydrolase YtcJ
VEVVVELDLLLTGCRARTMEAARPAASAIGVWQGRIVGFDGDVAHLRARRRIDLRGATVFPGFIDAHTHLTWTGIAANQPDLSRCREPLDVLEAVNRAAAAVPGDGWVELSGYDQRPLGAHLTRDDLEKAAPGRKVVLTHVSGHVCVVSDAVLALISDDELAAAGAGVVRDGSGRPTGAFEESALTAVRSHRRYRIDEIVDAIDAAGRQCLSEGVTMCADAGIAADLIGYSPLELAAYQSALEQGRLPLRVQTMIPAVLLREEMAAPQDGLGRALDLGLRTGLGDDMLSIGAMKMWLDGGMMARTAALTEPYAGGGSGQLAYDYAEAYAMVIDGHRGGWQLALHAIGDRAVDQAIELLSAAQAAYPRPDARHRVEHCGLVRPDQLAGLAAVGATAVIQPTFLHAFGDDYAAIMGESRRDWMYRGRSLLDSGIPVAGSSDRPVADGSPFRAMQFMIDRLSSGGASIGPSEATTLDEAVAAYTTGAAYACRAESVVGSLAVGKHADLVVLDVDPYDLDPSALADVQVVATLLAGRVVHGDLGRTA